MTVLFWKKRHLMRLLVNSVFFILLACQLPISPGDDFYTTSVLKYHQTVLKELDAVMLDGGRHFSPCPLLDSVKITGKEKIALFYRYFIRDSLEFCIHEFYYNKESMEAVWSDSRLMENILLFETEDEHQFFNYYLEQNWIGLKEQCFHDIRDPYVPDIVGYNTDHFRREIVSAQILHRILDKYREQNTL